MARHGLGPRFIIDTENRLSELRRKMDQVELLQKRERLCLNFLVTVSSAVFLFLWTINPAQTQSSFEDAVFFQKAKNQAEVDRTQVLKGDFKAMPNPAGEPSVKMYFKTN